MFDYESAEGITYKNCKLVQEPPKIDYDKYKNDYFNVLWHDNRHEINKQIQKITENQIYYNSLSCVYRDVENENMIMGNFRFYTYFAAEIQHFNLQLEIKKDKTGFYITFAKNKIYLQ